MNVFDSFKSSSGISDCCSSSGSDVIASETASIAGVMAGVLASRAGDCEFDPRLNQTKEYEIGICFLSAKYSLCKYYI
jgi:hypothetical protein